MLAVCAALISALIYNPVFGVAAASGSGLPDGRVYEQVSPSDKNGGNVRDAGSSGLTAQSSLDGGKIFYTSLNPFGEVQSAPFEPAYVASSGLAAWSSSGVDPVLPPTPEPQTLNAPTFVAFSASLSKAIFYSQSPVNGTSAILGQTNLYLRDNDRGSYTLLTGAMNPTNTVPTFGGASADWTHLIFAFNGALTTNAISGQNNLYEWVDGRVQLVNILPGTGETADVGLDNSNFGSGEPNSGRGPRGSAGLELTHAVSNSGSRIYWTDRDHGPSALYLREYTVKSDEEKGETVQIDATRGPGEKGRGLFWAASAEGERVFFTDPNRLTAGSTAQATGGACDEHGDLFEYQVTGASAGQLVDLTTNDPEGACIYGVLGVSEDGSYVYFVAGGNLAEGATAGQPNLYVLHREAGKTITTFIAMLSGNDKQNWMPEGIASRAVAVTPDGQHLAFVSQGCIDTEGNPAPCGDDEVYLYDAATEHLTCASCSRAGGRPIGDSLLPRAFSEFYNQRYLSESGSRLFFNSSDALAPQDTNGLQDVYEWERNGAGSCPPTGEGHVEEGCVFLLSGGTSGDVSSFADATPSGNDVFFTTRAQLFPQDTDQNVDLYDARVNGFSSESAVTSPECEGETCKPSPLQTPGGGMPTSFTFTGSGNLPPAAGTSVKAGSVHKKIKKHKPKRRHKQRARKAKRASTGGRR